MKKQQHHKIISTILILAFALGVLTCGEEDSGDLDLIWIPAGTFEMGETGVAAPVHDVTITEGFYMSRYLITQSQYYLVTGKQPGCFPSGGRGRLPVECVNWYDAIVFCNKLSIKHGLQPVYNLLESTNPDVWIADNGGKIPDDTNPNPAWDAVVPAWNANGYRLPTEAEWEYACRAGTTTPYNNGWDYLSDPPADAPGWYRDSIINGSPIDKTQEVGLKPPNAWGLYDMHGNIYELCWDWYSTNYYSNSQATDPDPKGPASSNIGYDRVIRGGSWDYSASGLRSAFRLNVDPWGKGYNIGLRVVRRP